MYRNQKRTIEDSLVSELYLETINQWEGRNRNTESFKKARELLEGDLKALTGSDDKLKSKVRKASYIAFNYFVDNKFDTRKCFITLATIGQVLNDNEMAIIPEGTLQVIEDTNAIVDQAYNDPDADLTSDELERIYNSCIKQASKIIKKLQENGYY